MRNFASLLVIAVFTLLWSCQQQTTSQSGYEIQGTIDHLEKAGWKPHIYLADIDELDHVNAASYKILFDTASINKDRRFSLSKDSLPSGEGLYRLNLSKNSSAVSFQSGMKGNHLFLYLQPGNQVEVQADARNFTYKYQVSGSEPSQIIQNISQQLFPFYKKAGKIVAAVKADKSIGKKETDSVLRARLNMIKKPYAQILKQFVDTVSHPTVAVWAAQYFGFFIPKKERRDYYRQLDQHWEDLRDDNKYVRQFHNTIVEFDSTLPKGSKAPPIALPDTSGDTLSLHQQKGKLTLIDFWASWCKPCREENRETVRPLYKKYRDSGFRVYSVSFDTKRENWIQAIHQDRIPWTTVIDQRGIKDSPLADTYRVDAVPTTYLIDGKGQIVAKDKRDHHLEKFVDHWFAEHQ